MPTLYLLRHAKSDWSDLTLPDERRGLSQRGRRDARLLAALLRRDHIEPDLILCSTAQRTRETLELLLAELGHSEVHLEPELYGASECDTRDALSQSRTPASRLLVHPSHAAEGFYPIRPQPPPLPAHG
jgi:phosphohistidine phosphatase